MRRNVFMICAAIISMMMPIAVRADEAQLSFTVSGSTLTVAAPAGVLDKNTSLYLVWDSSNKGTELDKWANKIKYENSENPVSDSEAQYEFDISSVNPQSVMRVLALSEIQLIDGYISIGDNQYVDTGVLATEAYGLEFKYFHTNDIDDKFGMYESLIGSVCDDFTVGGYRESAFYIRWNGAGHDNKFSGRVNNFETHTIKIIDGKVYFDDVYDKFNVYDETTKKPMGKHSRSILVGSTWANATSTATSGRYFWANWYYVKLFDGNGNELINLVPALVGSGETQKPVFYDTVHGRFFSNSGSGSLSCGPLSDGDASVSVTNTIVSLLAYSLVNSHIKEATWIGGGDTALISELANWEPNLPGEATTVTISSTADEKIPEVSDGVTRYSRLLLGNDGEAKMRQGQGSLQLIAANPMIIGEGNGNAGIYDISGGDLFCSELGDSYVEVGEDGGNGSLIVSGGTVECQYIRFGNNNSSDDVESTGYLELSGDGKLHVRKDVILGSFGKSNCSIQHKSGTLECEGYVYLAYTSNQKEESKAVAKYEMTDGLLTAKEAIVVGQYGKGEFYLKGGTVDVTGNGDFIVGGERSDPDAHHNGRESSKGIVEMTGGNIKVYRFTHIGASGVGEFVMSGGKFVCKNLATVGRFGWGIGKCTLNGGEFSSCNGLFIGESGKGELIVNESGLFNAYGEGGGITIGARVYYGTGNGSLKLQGGKIITKFIKKGAGTVNGVEFDGGTIEAKADEADFFLDLGEIQLKEGGVAIDTKGKNIGIRNCTFLVSGGGKIRVLGGGSVTFENVAVKFNGNPPEGTYVFAEYQGEDSGKFVNASTITASRRRAKVSENDRKISFLPNCFMVIVM